MTSSTVLVTSSETKNDKDGANGSTLPHSKKENHTRHLYRYQATRMVSNLDEVRTFVDPLDESNVFDPATLFHYCNLILDQYPNENATLALFQEDLNYGPQGEDVAIYFHPFEWKGQWHLAIGFTQYEKILFVNCSDYSLSEDSSRAEDYPSFSGKTSLRIQDFVVFFKQKLSINSLRYPRLYTDLFKPATGSNAVNLLTIIFAFCLDPVSLTRSFCDPQFSPTKFDISDFHPIIASIDGEFREELQHTNELKQKEKEKLVAIKKKESEHAKNVAKELKQKQKREREERERVEMEAEIKERQRMVQERIRLEKEDREKRAKERDQQQQQHDLHLAPIPVEHEVNGDVQTKIGDSLSTIQREKVKDEELETIVKRQKTRSRLGKSISAPIEINDLEDSDDASEEEKLPVKTQDVSRKETEETLRQRFQPVYALEFKKHILHSELFGDITKIDLMYSFIRQFSYDPLMNALLYRDGSADRSKKSMFELRKSLVVTYKRRMKQEFDESKFEKIMETDSLNQIIPLIFENGSIFLVNIKTSDKFNCIVKLICITNRLNRSEREIMKNYAFRRLIEMHVAKYNRLVLKIRTSIIAVKQSEFYKVAMASFCVLQRILWKNKFDLTYKPKVENLESYNVYFQKMMEGIETSDMLATELNLKRIVKYSLAG